MKEPKSESEIKVVEEGGSRFGSSKKTKNKDVAKKDFKQTRRGVVYLNVKAGDDVSSLEESKKQILREHGVI